MVAIFPPTVTLALGAFYITAVAQPMVRAVDVIQDDWAKSLAAAIYAAAVLPLIFRFIGFNFVHDFGRGLAAALKAAYEEGSR